MAKFLIEVPHESDLRACVDAIELFLRSGSHFLTHADWGCHDGEHCAWMVVDVDSKADALAIVPLPLRADARVIRLNTFSLQDLDEIAREHEVKAEASREQKGGGTR